MSASATQGGHNYISNVTVTLCIVFDDDRARKLPFALKVIDTGKVKGQEEAIENEVAILRRLKNRNVVQLIEEFHAPTATFLVMELVTVRIATSSLVVCMQDRTQGGIKAFGTSVDYWPVTAK